ncbi:pyocin activator PrtN family protein [Pseudoalteromonas sp. NSLLW24]|uniref:pyocin activator PrtN family protein n=1 Tax=Pseudoalteromonas sp. NSLLW24 TaxID=2792050 RepID=UPI0018CFADB9|nr:pyocin activator PrtN family protein [Pseudoalteromonas sp. NSLLW24]MBG9999448.1 pyocin activator PrtN family protein [Pseudoalteromonas sp. NSLLW24]
MNTNFALLARFETPVINLKDVCQEFFGISVKTAMQKIKGQDFPVPTFRLANSERSPVFIKVEDLAFYIDKQYQIASKEWQTVHMV